MVIQPNHLHPLARPSKMAAKLLARRPIIMLISTSLVITFFIFQSSFRLTDLPRPSSYFAASSGSCSIEDTKNRTLGVSSSSKRNQILEFPLIFLMNTYVFSSKKSSLSACRREPTAEMGWSLAQRSVTSTSNSLMVFLAKMSLTRLYRRAPTTSDCQTLPSVAGVRTSTQYKSESSPSRALFECCQHDTKPVEVES
jgi:hypothetical protein